jgi:hypothetical protein
LVESIQEKKGHGKLSLTPNLLLNEVSCHKKMSIVRKETQKNQNIIIIIIYNKKP